MASPSDLPLVGASVVVVADTVTENPTEGKCGKSTILQTSQSLIGTNCFLPGQSLGPKAHPGSDMAYYVLEGKGTFTIREEGSETNSEVPAEPGQILVVPAGALHAIKNTETEGRLVTLTVIAPPVNAVPGVKCVHFPQQGDE